jgi:hypothetical protein
MKEWKLITDALADVANALGINKHAYRHEIQGTFGDMEVIVRKRGTDENQSHGTRRSDKDRGDD